MQPTYTTWKACISNANVSQKSRLASASMAQTFTMLGPVVTHYYSTGSKLEPNSLARTMVRGTAQGKIMPWNDVMNKPPCRQAIEAACKLDAHSARHRAQTLEHQRQRCCQVVALLKQPWKLHVSLDAMAGMHYAPKRLFDLYAHVCRSHLHLAFSLMKPSSTTTHRHKAHPFDFATYWLQLIKAGPIILP